MDDFDYQDPSRSGTALSSKVLNIALVAAGVKAGCLDITFDELRAMIKKRMDPKYHAPNLRAVDIICKGSE
jgi:Pyruvate/2-oxoacid:ferredoxin oxidoreductase gamma subunit